MMRKEHDHISGRMVAALAAVVSFTATSAVAHANYRRTPAVACHYESANITTSGSGAAITMNASGNYGAVRGSATCPVINDTTISNASFSGLSNGATGLWVDFDDASGYDWVRAQACVLSNNYYATTSCAETRYSSNLSGGSNAATSASTTGGGYLYVDRTASSPSAGWTFEGYATVYVTIPGIDSVSGASSGVSGYFMSN